MYDVLLCCSMLCNGILWYCAMSCYLGVFVDCFEELPKFWITLGPCSADAKQRNHVSRMGWSSIWFCLGCLV